MQYVNCNNVKAELMTVKCGVPQGSVLGPLLFIIYINALKHCQCIMFADDSTLHISFPSMTELSNHINSINADLKLLAEWFRENKLSLNMTKTKYIIFINTRIDFNPGISISSQEIERVKSTKFLGLTIHDQIRFKFDSYLTYAVGICLPDAHEKS